MYGILIFVRVFLIRVNKKPILYRTRFFCALAKSEQGHSWFSRIVGSILKVKLNAIKDFYGFKGCSANVQYLKPSNEQFGKRG